MTTVAHAYTSTPFSAATTRSNPFPGLRPFGVEEAHLFFGRDGQSDELLRRLRENRFVAVVGTSGSGKSSLVRAGLIASLYGGLLRAAGSFWRVAIFRPGGDPIGNLARALDAPGILRADGNGVAAAPITEAVLRRGALGLIETAAEARLPAHQNLLILVDQFEELFRFRRTSSRPDDAAAFVKLLLEATRQREVPIYVILTMRSDFLGDCSQFRDLPEAINRGQYLIPRMTREERRLAITGPVAVGGGEISPRLLNRLLNDVGDDPDQLPILQHSLMRTWDHWLADRKDGAPLDLDSYLAIGGMTDALSRHAEEAFEELGSTRRKRVAELAFRRLTEKGPDNREVRRPTTVRELCAVAQASEAEMVAMLDTFRRAGRSFLMPPTDVTLTADSLIDISHESLIRGWGRLCQWVELEAESGKTYRRLAESATRFGRGVAGLLHDPDLEVALNWWKENEPNEAWAQLYDPAFAETKAFLEKSRKARDADVAEKQRQRRRQLRRAQAVAAVLLVLLAASTWLGVRARQMADNVRSTNAQLRVQKDSADAARVRADENATVASLAREEAVAHGEIAEEEAARASTAEQLAHAEAQRARDARMLAQQEALRVRVNDFNNNTLIEYLATMANRETSRGERIYARFYRARALAYLGRHDTAAAEYTRILDEVPSYLVARINRCDEYVNLGLAAEAVGDCRRALNRNPNAFLAHLNLALAWTQLRRHDSAVISYRKAIETTRFESYPFGHSLVSPDIRRVAGRLSLRLEAMEVKSALHYGAASVLAYEGDAGFQDELARGDREPHSVDAALTALNWIWLRELHVGRDSAIRAAAAGDYGALAVAGALWQRAGYPEQARRSYDEFERAHQSQPQARYRMLAEWVRRERGRATPSDVARSASHEVEDIRARLLETREFHARERRDSALAVVSSAIRRYPGNVDLLLERAGLRYNREQAPAAFDSLRADADRILSLSPDLAEAHFYRAWVDWQTRPWTETRAYRDTIRTHLRQTLAHDPGHAGAHAVSFWMLHEEQPRQALVHLQRAKELSPTYLSHWVYYNIARTQNRLGRYAEARASIDSAIALKGDSLPYYRERARADSGLGRSPADIARTLAIGFANIAQAKARRGVQDAALTAYGSALAELVAPAAESAAVVDPEVERIVSQALGMGFTRDALDHATAQALNDKGRYAEALQAAEAAIAAQPDSLKYYVTRTTAEEGLGIPRVAAQLKLASIHAEIGRIRQQRLDSLGSANAHYSSVYTLLRLQLDTTSAEISAVLSAAIDEMSQAIIRWQGSPQKAAEFYRSLIDSNFPRDVTDSLRAAVHRVFRSEAERLASSQ
jgi:tetratricopeptide (TPR) repeat protein